MGLFIDIAIAAIIAVFVIWGYRKGFIKSVMGLVSLVVALVVAINFYSYTAEFINERFVEPYFTQSTADDFSSLMNGGTETIAPEKIFEDNPDTLSDILDKYGVDLTAVSDYYEKNIKPTINLIDVDDIASRLSTFVVDSTTKTVSNILGFLITFFGALIILNLILKLMDLLFKLPVLKFTNKLFGAILGIVKGLVVAVIVINVISGLITAIGDSDNAFLNEASLETSNAYKTVYSAGLITKIGK